MASSLMNTQECKDSTETVYDPPDIYCKYAETISNKGELNFWKSSCVAKLLQDEIPQMCCKCKGIKFKRIMPDVDSLTCSCGEDKKIGERYCDFCEAIHEVGYIKPGSKEKNCDRCKTPITNMEKKYCEECRIVVDKETQVRKNAQKVKKRKQKAGFGY
jgi:hypothetical protein